MKYTLPSDNINLFQSLIGQKVIEVSRRLLESDLALEDYEQMADGATELVFDDGRVISFFSWTEIFSVGVVANEKIPRSGGYSIYKNLTNNSFWKQRVSQKITKVTIFKSIYATEDNPLEFGIEFEFENNLKICIEYVDGEEISDTLRVIEENEETRCTKTVLSNCR